MEALAPIRESLREGKDAVQIREQVATLIMSVDKEEILAGLSELRFEFHDAGLEAAEDTILEIMDFLVGWCAPTMRL